MIYVTFERGGPKFSSTTARALECSLAHSRAAVSVESKVATMQHKILYVREFIKTESVTAVRRVFHLCFNIHPPTRKSICHWNHQFEQIGCLCKGKSSGRPRVSEENMRRIQESFEHSPRQPVAQAENLEYHNQPSGVYWGTVYCSTESIFLNHPVYFVILHNTMRMSHLKVMAGCSYTVFRCC